MEGKADLILFDSYVGISNRTSLLPQYVKLFHEQQTFAVKPHKDLQPVIAVINGKLNTAVDREEGLQLLKVLLPQCSDEIFIENYLYWMQQCVKGLEYSALSHEVLGDLLLCSSKVPELTKTVTSAIVGKVIETLPKVNPEVTVSCLKCLEVLMQNYGPTCGFHRGRLEQFLFSFADSQDALEVESAARCISVAALMGGGGAAGKNHKAAWKLLQEKIISEVHQTLDILFEDVPEGQVFQKFTCPDSCGLPALENANPVKRIHQLSVRIINLLKFLEGMLLHELPVPKVIQPSLFINLIGRGVSVNGNVISKSVTEKIILSCSLPGIHVAELKLLNALIMCCGRNLLGFGYIICQLLLETLNWTRVPEYWPYGATKPFAELRIEACHTLVSWLKIARGGSCLELCSAEQVVLQLLSDMRVKKPSMSLSIDNSGAVRGNQKWKQPQRNFGQIASRVLWNRQKIMNPSANFELCSAATAALQWIFQVAGVFLKPTLHKMVQETVVQLLFGLVRASTCQELPVPYSSAACRLQLYSLLFTLSIQPHPAWPAPVQYALQFFKMGQNDDDIQVSGFCMQSLSTLVQLMHPPSSSMQFPVVYKDTERDLEFQESEKSLQCLASKFEGGKTDNLPKNVLEPIGKDSSDVEDCTIVLDSGQATTTDSPSFSPTKPIPVIECDQSKEIIQLKSSESVSSVAGSSNDSEVMEVEVNVNSSSSIEEVREMSHKSDKPSSTNLRENSTESSSDVSDDIQVLRIDDSSNISSENCPSAEMKNPEVVSAIELKSAIGNDNMEQGSEEGLIDIPIRKECSNLATPDSKDKQNVYSPEKVQASLTDGTRGKTVEIDNLSQNDSNKNESFCKVSSCKEHTDLLATPEKTENKQEEKDGSNGESHDMVACGDNAQTSNDEQVNMVDKTVLEAEILEKNEKLTEDKTNGSTASNGEQLKEEAALEDEMCGTNNEIYEKLPESESNGLTTLTDEPARKKAKVDTEAEINKENDEFNDLISSFKDNVVDQ